MDDSDFEFDNLIGQPSGSAYGLRWESDLDNMIPNAQYQQQGQNYPMEPFPEEDVYFAAQPAHQQQQQQQQYGDDSDIEDYDEFMQEFGSPPQPTPTVSFEPNPNAPQVAVRPVQQQTQIPQSHLATNVDPDDESMKVSVVKKPVLQFLNEHELKSLQQFVMQRNISMPATTSPGVTPFACNKDSLSTFVTYDEQKDLLGKGAYGSVYRGSVTLPQNAKTYNVAVKNQKYDNERTVRNLKNEIDLWNYVSLKHEEMPFVALYFGSCDDVASANVGTNIELMESGLVSVEKLVQTTFIDTVNALKITLQILMTLAWLAKEMDITHNDLGTRNVIVTLPMNKDTQGDADRNSFVYNVCGRKYRIDTNNFMIKIIDFGLATHGTAEHADVPYDMMYKMKGIQKPYTMDDLVAGLKRQKHLDHLSFYDIPVYARDMIQVLSEMLMYVNFDMPFKIWVTNVLDSAITLMQQNQFFSAKENLCQFVAAIFSVEYLKTMFGDDIATLFEIRDQNVE